MLMLGLPRRTGLVSWSAAVFRMQDYAMHGVVGFFLAMSLEWLMGARRVWLGVAGAGVSILAGAAGELVQYVATDRQAQWSDFRAHAVGSAAALVPYLLAVGSRWWESPDARRTGDASYHLH